MHKPPAATSSFWPEHPSRRHSSAFILSVSRALLVGATLGSIVCRNYSNTGPACFPLSCPSFLTETLIKAQEDAFPSHLSSIKLKKPCSSADIPARHATTTVLLRLFSTLLLHLYSRFKKNTATDSICVSFRF